MTDWYPNECLTKRTTITYFFCGGNENNVTIILRNLIIENYQFEEGNNIKKSGIVVARNAILDNFILNNIKRITYSNRLWVSHLMSIQL